MGMIKFTSTRVLPVGKKGIIKPDSDGYYTTVLGGLNILNSAGAYYVCNDAVRKLFEQSSTLMRRIKKGVLKAELGHPKQTPGMSDIQYYQRIMDIDEKNVCAHIAEVWLDDEFGKKHPEYNNPNMIGILGKVAPSGPYASTLKIAMESPKENCCFSIRSITEDHWEKGRTTKVLKTIVCWDFVGEPGLAIATKYNSPSLENFTLVDEDMPITKRQIERLIGDNITGTNLSTESREILHEVLYDTLEKPISVPAYVHW